MRVNILAIILFVLAGTGAWAEEFKLSNGDIIKGEIAGIAEEGLTVRLDVGGFSDRISWTKFTQETLKALAGNPQARQYVEPFIEIPLELKAKVRPKKREFRPMTVSRVALPPEKGDLLGAITLPANLLIMGLIFVANLFAAYEIAIFRERPVALVCGLAVVLPIVTPIVFLSLPEAQPELAPAGVAGAGEAEVKHREAATHAPAGGGLSMAKVDKNTGGGLEAAFYKRGETTFNRRFFETKFAGFFRVVLGDKEKQMIIIVKTSRDEYVARRIARITANEMHLQLLAGNEVSVSFGDIAQVQLRPKED